MANDDRLYVEILLKLYLSLPETPSRTSRYDRQPASQFCERGRLVLIFLRFRCSFFYTLKCSVTTSFYLQGMDDLTIADVLYSWDREAQTQMVRQELAAGTSLRDAQVKQFSREYLILGEALAAFDYADMYFDPPVLILDEADKLTEKIEDMLLQLLGRGCAHVPRFGNIGVSDRSRWPIVILLSNDIRHDLSSPLRSRCIYTWLEPPTPCEEVRILHARAPLASPDLVGGVTRLINCVRRDMPAVRDKPGLRESIDLLEALARDGVNAFTADVIDQYLCFLGKRHKELLNLRQGLARLETAARRADEEIDEWVEWAFANRRCVLEKAA
ncbi:MAG: hypothetical protein ACREAB_03770 [Blastocatellia bacterium]